MKKIIVLTTATALLSSCGIYTKYQPAETTPDNLYGGRGCEPMPLLLYARRAGGYRR